MKGDALWAGGVLEDKEDAGEGAVEVGGIEGHCDVDSKGQRIMMGCYGRQGSCGTKGFSGGGGHCLQRRKLLLLMNKGGEKRG